MTWVDGILIAVAILERIQKNDPQQIEKDVEVLKQAVSIVLNESSIDHDEWVKLEKAHVVDRLFNLFKPKP